MNEDLKKELIEGYRNLPKALKTALSSSSYLAEIKRISLAHNLSGEQEKKLFNETTLVMIGIARTIEFIKNIEVELGVEIEEAAKIARDINASIFLPVKQDLRDMENRIFPEIKTEPNIPPKKIEPPKDKGVSGNIPEIKKGWDGTNVALPQTGPNPAEPRSFARTDLPTPPKPPTRPGISTTPASAPTAKKPAYGKDGGESVLTNASFQKYAESNAVGAPTGIEYIPAESDGNDPSVLESRETLLREIENPTANSKSLIEEKMSATVGKQPIVSRIEEPSESKNYPYTKPGSSDERPLKPDPYREPAE
ncbi:MAG: hypothetical protein A3G59_01515 [Candidatus Taylorbacteria bacterium RIFCSPLOWO2_12_FULL_47_20]|uniref:Uncharacterized protein n=2 Tax=Candidatus Tayloriibacteriota TaxID=1817919 RepID=A0A1G2P6L8_9BACT|nr:MAG: hypothetical protein A3H68_01095 [Candidatus Taylorbacteria bacterium RIFCSPLOWO2_02_FULL_46_40]OHA43977.1 MAG: hypothetical protein A3G59_01515 [Candidatus Taylorbacteria bacterium RIFCSPLOWO2_12_FULL_47_20]